MYSFVKNDPINLIDPFGLSFHKGPWHPKPGEKTACRPEDDCDTIKFKMWQLQIMIISHQTWDWMIPKPRGGNKHVKDIKDMWIQFANCQQLYNQKCKCDKDKDGGKGEAEKCTVLILTAVVAWKLGKIIIGGMVAGPCGALVGGFL